jgi:HK97 family phage major capsid protein
MSDPRVLAQRKAELRGKIDSYKASPAASKPEFQSVIATCEDEIATINASLDRFDVLASREKHERLDSGLNPAIRPQGTDAGSDFGWPGSARRGRGNGSLREAMRYATPEQCEEFEEFSSYLSGRSVSALANLTPGGDGGVLLPVFVQQALERNYSQFSPVRDNARIFGTDTGADEVYPVLSDSEVGEQIAPAALTGADATVSGDTPPTTLTGPTMKAWKISSKPVYVPRETFTDSDIDIVQEVLGALLARITRFENSKYTKGVGTTEAEGFLYEASNFEGFDTLDLDVCLDIAYSVPQLYRPNGKYMMSDSTAKYLRKLVTGIAGDKRKLWADADFTKGTPPTLHGYPVVINNDMNDVASNGTYTGGLNSPLAFGDFSKFVVREAEQGRPFIYRYPVPAKDGSGLIAFRRSDSKLIVPVAIAKLNPSGS